MVLGKITKDIYGKSKEKSDEKGKEGLNGEKFIEVTLIILIIVSSVNLTYWLVPSFLTISFVLIQLRKVVNKFTK